MNYDLKAGDFINFDEGEYEDNHQFGYRQVLKDFNIQEEAPTIAKIEGTFCITGKSSLGSRATLKEMIEAAGGKVTGSVSSKTTYLVANKPENTAKYNNALQFGTKIINDEELLQLLGK